MPALASFINLTAFRRSLLGPYAGCHYRLPPLPFYPPIPLCAIIGKHYFFCLYSILHCNKQLISFYFVEHAISLPSPFWVRAWGAAALRRRYTHALAWRAETCGTAARISQHGGMRLGGRAGAYALRRERRYDHRREEGGRRYFPVSEKKNLSFSCLLCLPSRASQGRV